MEATLRAEAARAASAEAVAAAAAKTLQVTQLQNEFDASRGAVASLESEVELSRAAAVEVCERAAAEVSLLRAQLQEAQVAASDAEEAASSLRRQLASATPPPPPPVSSAIDADADTSASGKQLATDLCAASKASQEESARLSGALQAAHRALEEAESKAVHERATLRLQEAKQVELIRGAELAELAALRSSHEKEMQQLGTNLAALEEELRVQDRRVKDAEMSRSQVGGCMSSWVAGCVAGC